MKIRSLIRSLLMIGALAEILWAAEPAMPLMPLESFDDFFVEFMEKPEYQKSRVQFPLVSITVQMESDKSDTAKVERHQWKFNDFKALRAGVQVRQYDNFERKLRDSDERVVSLMGNDNGIMYSYYFKRIEGRWYLVRVLDESS